MNYLDLYSSYLDRTIAEAWDSQIKEASKAPWISETLNRRGNELFQRFAVCYVELRALPRRLRDVRRVPERSALPRKENRSRAAIVPPVRRTNRTRCAGETPR